MRVLIHHDPQTMEPLGVWSIPDSGAPVLRYLDTDARAYAEALIADQEEGVVWRDLAGRLAERYPATAWWELVETDELDLPVGPSAHVEGIDSQSSSDEPRDELEAVLEIARRRWAGTNAESGTPRFEAATRRRRFTVSAERLADRVLGTKSRVHEPNRRVSESIVLRRDPDDTRLVVVVGAQEGHEHVDAALAYGLTFQEDRDLYLVLPDEARDVFRLGVIDVWEPTRQRLAHVATPVRLWTYVPTDHSASEWLLEERIAPPKHLALAATKLDAEIPTGTLALDETRNAWIAPLVAWADGHVDLDANHRLDFLSWHAGGRQVLHVTRSGSGLRVIAGKNYSAHRPEPSPEPIDLSGPITSAQLDEITTTVEEAAALRLGGEDVENLEHLLQDRLAKPAGVAALGLVGELVRELPATRPGQRRGFIDLIGLDERGNLHLIETKLAPDKMLSLQGLDYWCWLSANFEEVCQLLREDGHPVAKQPRLLLDYVVGTMNDGAADTVDLRYLCPQVEAFDGGINWRIGHVSGWRAPNAALQVEWFDRRQSPDVPGRTLERFGRRIQRHLVADARDGLDKRGWWRSMRRAVIPAAHRALFRLAEDRLLHDKVRNPRSSQLFALNLFGGIDTQQAAALVRHVDPTVISADPPIFEFIDRLDRLAEATAASPHTTQVDVAIRARCSDGTTHLLLIEVKLTEDDFNPCSAYQSERNDRLDLCETTAPFGGSPTGCFQLRNHDRGDRRRYDIYLQPDAESPTTDALGGLALVGCPFRTSGNQVMRNLALAGLLASEPDIDRVTFVLCAHDEYQVIWRRWRDACRLIHPLASVGVAELPASSVLAELAPDVAEELGRRYALPARSTSDQDRLVSAIQTARSFMTRVAGEGSTLEQLERVLLRGEFAGAADGSWRALAQRLELLTEQVRETRADAIFDALKQVNRRDE